MPKSLTEPRPTGLPELERWTWPIEGQPFAQPIALQAGLDDVLALRTSEIGRSSVNPDQLASILFHASSVREERRTERSHWQSRTAPAAGGLHVIELACFDLEMRVPPFWYDVSAHAAVPLEIDTGAIQNAQETVFQLTGARHGQLIQFVADGGRMSTRYEDCESLMWRDAGCLVTTFAFIGAALSIRTTPLGAHRILEATPSKDRERWTYCGGLLLTA